MSKSCIICGGEESDGEVLREAPCGIHWVCADDIASFFERAAANESLFPPKCCHQIFLLSEYEDFVPFETAWAYQLKEQGEYAVQARYRVYCANPVCSKFCHPSTHIKDNTFNVEYATCEGDDCRQLTCCTCKSLITDGIGNHTCHQAEDEQKFKAVTKEKGYQECNECGATVELAEACNHITCECGNQFCYVCGKTWSGLHGCPAYGPAVYDEEGYNQHGFHRDTGRNREGRSAAQQQAHIHGEPDPEQEPDPRDDPEWDVLQHLNQEFHAMIQTLPLEERLDALDQLRIMLHEQQGIMFEQDHGLQAEEPEDDGDEMEEGEVRFPVVHGWDPEAVTPEVEEGQVGADEEGHNSDDDGDLAWDDDEEQDWDDDEDDIPEVEEDHAPGVEGDLTPHVEPGHLIDVEEDFTPHVETGILIDLSEDTSQEIEDGDNHVSIRRAAQDAELEAITRAIEARIGRFTLQDWTEFLARSREIIDFIDSH